MSLMCQQNSYLKELQAKVTSCKPAKLTLVENNKKTTVQGFEVILNDTILFPEGGGQPDDRGTINDVPVLRITKVGKDAVHFVETEIPENSDVVLKLDWQRRFDHMQQHTAQHLISALAEKFGIMSTSWSIGTDILTIELDTPLVTDAQLKDIEMSANQSIRDCVPVVAKLYRDRSHPDLEKFQALDLPADQEEPVRVLNIEGIDSNPCCGTHISNLSQIQAIKILMAEKGKKNKMNVLCLAGDRLLKYVGQSFAREKVLTGLLKGPAANHCDLADKALKGLKLLQKINNQQQREMAVLEAAMFKQADKKDVVFVKHRKEGDNDYMSVLVGELANENIPKLITVGDDKEGGMFILTGSAELVKDLGQQICDLLGGKGAPSNGLFRGKASKLTNRQKAETLLRDYVKAHTVLDKEN